MNRRIYLSGKMSGKPDWNAKAFANAEAELRAQGFTEIFNPATLHPSPKMTHEELKAAGLWTKTWQYYLKRDIALIAAKIDEIRVIDNEWVDSQGARLEIFVAHKLGIPVRDLKGCPVPYRFVLNLNL